MVAEDVTIKTMKECNEDPSEPPNDFIAPWIFLEQANFACFANDANCKIDPTDPGMNSLMSIVINVSR